MDDLSDDAKKFMAHQGLMQWLRACISQRGSIQTAVNNLHAVGGHSDNVSDTQTQCHYFAVSAAHVLHYADWTRKLGILKDVKFDELKTFDWRAIIDLRNMREHQIDYFDGRGKDRERWFIETPEYASDASSLTDSVIGGRLDYEVFADSCQTLLVKVKASTDF